MRAKLIPFQNKHGNCNYCLLLVSSKAKTGNSSVETTVARPLTVPQTKGPRKQTGYRMLGIFESQISQKPSISLYRLAFTLLGFQDTLFLLFL